MRVLLAVGAIACNVPPSHGREACPPPSQHTLIALHRLDAHDAAVSRNAMRRQLCEIARDLRRSTFTLLYGSDPASPGAAIAACAAPIRWEQRGAELDVVELTARLSDGSPEVCSSSDDPEAQCPFECTDDAPGDCRALAWQLRDAWGESQDDEWLDRSHRIRASVRLDRYCELRFQRYVAPAAWIAMTDAAEVPLALLGEPVRRLPAFADHSWSYDPAVERYHWPLAVTGEHIQRASIDALAKGGRIVRLEVAGELDEDGGADELHALVRPFLGRLPIEVHTRGTRFELAIGE